MAHRYHPGKNDPQDAIYFDDCEDCDHHVARIPYYQDQHKMNQLWERMLIVETGSVDESYRTRNEQKACMELWKLYIFLERFTNINPHLVQVGQEST